MIIIFDTNTILENIKPQRQKLKISKDKLEILTNISKAEIHKYENGNAKPIRFNLELIGKTLRLLPSDMQKIYNPNNYFSWKNFRRNLMALFYFTEERQSTLCKKIGIKTENVLSWTRGKATPTTNELIKLGKFFNVSYIYFGTYVSTVEFVDYVIDRFYY